MVQLSQTHRDELAHAGVDTVGAINWQRIKDLIVFILSLFANQPLTAEQNAIAADVGIDVQAIDWSKLMALIQAILAFLGIQGATAAQAMGAAKP